jgi:hypothetical protein
MKTIENLDTVVNINEEIEDIVNEKVDKKKKFDIIINYL